MHRWGREAPSRARGGRGGRGGRGAPAADGRALPARGCLQHRGDHLEEDVRAGAEGLARPAGDAVWDGAVLRAQVGENSVL